MLQSTSKEAAVCYQRAADARRRANDATDPAIRADFLNMEQRWLSLAQSYEFTERLTRVTGEIDRRDGR